MSCTENSHARSTELPRDKVTHNMLRSLPQQRAFHSCFNSEINPTLFSSPPYLTLRRK